VNEQTVVTGALLVLILVVVIAVLIVFGPQLGNLVHLTSLLP
jgi:hypothetical protein